MANLSSWSENDEQAKLSFERSLLKQSKYSKDYMLNKTNFVVINSFQRYIPSDKSIIQNKEDSKHD
jgi:hypothetical protein